MESALPLFILFAAVAYFLPAMVAAGRHHHQTAAIFTLDLLLGWTLLGWIAALVWSLTAVQPAVAGDRVAAGMPEEPYREI